MNARWVKALAFLAAAGATAAVMAKSRRDPSWLRTEPAFEEEPVPAVEPPLPASAESDPAPEAAPIPEAAAAEKLPENAACAEATPEGVENADEVAAIPAREAAVLFAYDAIHDRAVAGERVVCLAIGDVHEMELGEGRAHIVVPLELSHRSVGRVPRTRAATLHVFLEGGPTAWRITSHSWE